MGVEPLSERVSEQGATECLEHKAIEFAGVEPLSCEHEYERGAAELVSMERVSIGLLIW